MGRRRAFRIDAAPDYFEVEDGVAHHIDADGLRTEVHGNMAMRLIEGAEASVAGVDPMKGTSIQAYHDGRLTVGDLFGTNQEEDSEKVADMRARAGGLEPGGKPSYEVVGEGLTVGDLFHREEVERPRRLHLEKLERERALRRGAPGG